jgi:hypothetical protein
MSCLKQSKSTYKWARGHTSSWRGYGDEKEVVGYFFGSLGLLIRAMLECSPPLEIATMIINNQKERNNG